MEQSDHGPADTHTGFHERRMPPWRGAGHRRKRVAGGTVFFTQCLAEKGSDLLLQEITLLRWCVGMTLRERPVDVLAWVVLPDEMHAIWRLPPGDSAYARRWSAIKGRFSRGLAEAGRAPDRRFGARPARGEVGLWQKRFWEHHLAEPEDFATHMRFCFEAPWRAGLVKDAKDWPYSSFALQVARNAG